jgi:hypothetical protein
LRVNVCVRGAFRACNLTRPPSGPQPAGECEAAWVSALFLRTITADDGIGGGGGSAGVVGVQVRAPMSDAVAADSCALLCVCVRARVCVCICVCMLVCARARSCLRVCVPVCVQYPSEISSTSPSEISSGGCQRTRRGLCTPGTARSTLVCADACACNVRRRYPAHLRRRYPAEGGEVRIRRGLARFTPNLHLIYT